MRLVILAAVTLLGCARDTLPRSEACGAGTHDENGTCVVDVRCGTGTHLDVNTCVADPLDLSLADFASPPDLAVAIPPDLAATPDLAPAPDLALVPDFGHPITYDGGVPDAAPSRPSCSSDDVTGLTTTGSIQVAPAIDFVALCSGLIVMGNQTTNQLVEMNPASTATPVSHQLTASPGRLALDAERDWIYVAMTPTTKVAKLNRVTGAVSYAAPFVLRWVVLP